MDNKLTSVNLAEGVPEVGTYKAAVASSDGIVVNQHFGRACLLYTSDAADD